MSAYFKQQGIQIDSQVWCWLGKMVKKKNIRSITYKLTRMNLQNKLQK